MNTPDFEQPALTAYALGELNPAEAATVRRMIATSPEVRAEYECIEKTVAAMRNTPAIPRRTLAQRQRETVLAMGQSPSRSAKVIPLSYGARSHPQRGMGFCKICRRRLPHRRGFRAWPEICTAHQRERQRQRHRQGVCGACSSCNARATGRQCAGDNSEA